MNMNRIHEITKVFEHDGSYIATGLAKLCLWLKEELFEISRKEDKTMTALETLEAKVDALNVSIVAVANLVASLKAQIANGLTPDQVTTVAGQLDSSKLALDTVVTPPTV